MGTDQTRRPQEQPNNPQRQAPGQQQRQGQDRDHQDRDRQAGKPAAPDGQMTRDKR